jgi:curved DNA-binding protein CbpA
MNAHSFTHNYYEVMGLDPSASQVTIDAEYDALVAQCLTPDGQMIDKRYEDYFDLLTAAHATLRNPTSRSRHDKFWRIDVKSETTADQSETNTEYAAVTSATRHKLPLIVMGIWLVTLLAFAHFSPN